MTDVAKLQARIDAALTNPETGRPWMYSSPYLGSIAVGLQDRLKKTAREGGLDAMMDEFDRLRQVEDEHQLRIALAQVLFNDPVRQELGIRLP
jgi:hypothetical protein